VPQSLTPFLWFDNRAEEATRFYVSVFQDAEILSINRYGDAGPGQEGTVMTTEFLLNGQSFVALNGGPEYKFTPAISFVIHCDTQDEVDHYWDRLSEGGEPNVCGWLTDKFGVTWQVVPNILMELMQDADREKANRVTEAMLQMTKIEIPKLQAAYDQA